jgi:lipoprotein-releasing system ATP-binding protein
MRVTDAMPVQAIAEANGSSMGAESTLFAGGSFLKLENLRKSFRSGAAEIHVLAGVNLSVRRGETVAITGPSGAGKSTLLHILGALDTPTNGTVYFERKLLGAMNEADLADFRRHSVGFVWQRHHLLPDFTAAENVAMPLMMQGVSQAQAIADARDCLDEVGLSERGGQNAARLSGGEQQRVAIARALVTRPQLLLADEPTGDLDEDNAEKIFELLQRMHTSHHLTSILATHNLSLARRADRLLRLDHGLLQTVAPSAAGPAPAGVTTSAAAWKERG